MYLLTCHIAIGSLSMKTVHDVRIKKSIHSFVDTALIKIPATARLQQKGAQDSESVETAKQFQEGDPVTINLGFDGQLETEFVGFVKRVNFTAPCEIECEGYSWQLRRQTFVKAWKDPSVKDILQHIIAGTDIKMSSDIPDQKIDGHFRLNNENGTQALDKLKKLAAQTIYFIGDTLYSGLEETAQLDKAVTYRLGWNTIKDDELKFRREEDVKVQVRINFKDKKGKTHHRVIGQGGGIAKTVSYGVVTDGNLLEQMANKKAKEFRYSGYEGKVSCFLRPFAQPGYKAIIEDEKYPERSGAYILEATEVQFGMQGGRRSAELGKTVNRQ